MRVWRDWLRRFDRDWRALGGGHYAVWVGMPWGVEVPALVMVSTRWGWARRPEAGDPRWTAYAIGPAVVAVCLLGGLGGSGGDEAGPVGDAARVDLGGAGQRRA